jgi:hypothetical protein
MFFNGSNSCEMFFLFPLIQVRGGRIPPFLLTGIYYPNDPRRNQRMLRFKTPHLFLLLGLIAPVSSFASEHYCIAVDGGFGHGGTTFIGSGFALPSDGTCKPWSGFTKTASTVILTTAGTGCLSSDGKELTVSVSSADPSFLGSGTLASDYIQLTRGNSKEAFQGSDFGYFSGSAEPVTCSSSLLHLPSTHD